MARGALEVVLVSAHGLKSGDLFSKTDPYVIISCSTQSQRSNTARNQGGNPVWNQKFDFSVEEGTSELTLKIMDEDLLTADDELGTAKIPLSSVLSSGKLPATAYNVVRPDGRFKGEVKVALTFTPRRQESYHRAHAVHASSAEGPYGSSNTGGWKEGM